MPKTESEAIRGGGRQPDVLNYAPQLRAEPNSAQWILVCLSMLSPAFFVGYVCKLFGHQVILLMLVLAVGLNASILAVAMSGKDVTRWAVSFVGLCLNLACATIVACYAFNGH